MQRLYHTTQWKTLRRYRLSIEPLCRFCKKQGKTVAASVVDHIEPHKGDRELFYDFENTQSLCKRCHDSAKKYEENKGYKKDVGIDGWHIDPRHPRNTGR